MKHRNTEARGTHRGQTCFSHIGSTSNGVAASRAHHQLHHSKYLDGHGDGEVEFHNRSRAEGDSRPALRCHCLEGMERERNKEG